MKLADDPSPTYPPAGVTTRLAEVESALAALADDLVPERVPGHQLERVMGLLGRIERRAGGARLVLAKAAADAGAWRAAGARSAAEHLARQSGTSVGEAKADLAASERLAKLEQARRAALGGELSKNKTRTVAEGADADPDAESDLVATAKNQDLGAVRDKARQARQRADQDSGQAARRRYLRRALRLWTETDGEGRGLWNVPVEFQATIAAALEPYRQEAFRLARAAGTQPSHEALMADALQLLCLDTLADLDLDAPEGFFDPASPDGPCTGHEPADDTTGETTPRGSGGEEPADETTGQTSTGPDGEEPADETTGESGGDEPAASPTGHTSPPRQGDGDWYRNDTTRPHHLPGPGEPDTLFPPGPNGGHPPGPPRSETGRPDRPPGPANTPQSRRGPPHDEPTPPGGQRRSARRFAQRRRIGGNRRRPHQVVVNVDHSALVRGRVEGEETCEITGIGPVPVSTVQRMCDDAILRVIVTKGVDVVAISTDTRYVAADVQRALNARDPQCVVPGCQARHHLQNHHWRYDYAAGSPTDIDHLARICPHHHALITHCGWTLTGGPGHWQHNPPSH